MTVMCGCGAPPSPCIGKSVAALAIVSEPRLLVEQGGVFVEFPTDEALGPELRTTLGSRRTVAASLTNTGNGRTRLLDVARLEGAPVTAANVHEADAVFGIDGLVDTWLNPRESRPLSVWFEPRAPGPARTDLRLRFEPDARRCSPVLDFTVFGVSL